MSGGARIGIRTENKGPWERRAPLTPAQVGRLIAEHGVTVAVQPSPVRAYRDAEYAAAGADLTDDLTSCNLILGVKEVPLDRLVRGTSYLYFSHVIKGQEQNMPILARHLELGTTLLDYEKVCDAEGRRLIFFGEHAGYAGAVDALWLLGRRLAAEGIDNPFQTVRSAKEYDDVAAAESHLRGEVSQAIRDRGIPESIHPLVFGVTGGGNVSRGAQRILGNLPRVELTPAELLGLAERDDLSRNAIYQVVFRTSDRADFAPYLDHLGVLINGIYWEEGHPVLVRREDLQRLYGGDSPPRLRILADLSCDVDGSIQATVKTTKVEDPCYVYDPTTHEATSGVEGPGPVVLAVDYLPAEVPKDATEHFGEQLLPFLPSLARADFSRALDALDLEAPMRRALIAHRGELTPEFGYLRQFLGG